MRFLVLGKTFGVQAKQKALGGFSCFHPSLRYRYVDANALKES